MSKEDTAIRVGIENGRARYAFETVENFVRNNRQQPKNLDEYRSYVKKLPSMIKVNGLGQTLAYCYSAKSNQYHELFNHIQGWIKEKQPDMLMRYSEGSKMDFMQIVVSMNSNDYRIISNEVLALLDWMRRFADGMIRDQN